MNIIQTFLIQILQVNESELSKEMASRLAVSPFSESMLAEVDLLLDANPRIVDDLWKFSVSLDIPHQLLFDSFQLQCSVNQRKAKSYSAMR